MNFDKKNVVLFWLFITMGIVFVVTIVALVPNINLDLFVVLFPAVMLPASIVVFRTINGNFFTILTFYSLIFMMECFGGAVGASMSNPLAGRMLFSPATTAKVVKVYFIGYLVFLAGYYATYRWFWKRRFRHRNQATLSSKNNSRYTLSLKGWHVLFLLLLITTSLSFVQIYQRIETAGGLSIYLSSMYLYRYGTFAKDITANSFVVLANLLGGISLSLVSVGLMVSLKVRISRTKRFLLFSFLLIIILHALILTFRSTAFFSIVALVAVYNHIRPIRLATLIRFLVVLSVLLVILNFFHNYMYFKTAGWEYQNFTASLGRILAPHGHLQTLQRILSVASHSDFLYGKTLPESFFFFFPRFLWEAKAEQYGTKIVQTWAGLPYWYQMAPTSVGELIAHFGFIGMSGMILHGAVHGFLETFRFRSLPLQAGYFCSILPRLLAHSGMGISAVAITLFQLALLYILTKPIQIRKLTNTGLFCARREKALH